MGLCHDVWLITHGEKTAEPCEPQPSILEFTTESEVQVEVEYPLIHLYITDYKVHRSSNTRIEYLQVTCVDGNTQKAGHSQLS